MSTVFRHYPLGFTQISLHFPGFTREKRATGKKVKIAVTQIDLDQLREWYDAQPPTTYRNF